MENNKILICEDSIEGVFSGIYYAYELRYDHDRIQLCTGVDNYELFCEYIPVETVEEKAWKVSRTICDRLGYEVYQNICSAIASTEKDKADAVYHTIVIGLRMKRGSAVLNYLSNPYVMRISELNRSVWYEAHHFREFVRFHELKNGILFSKIHPVNDVLTLIAPHFADRLPLENFMIYDANRNTAIVHEKGKQWVYYHNTEVSEQAASNYSDQEEYYSELFQGFCKSISIESRENKDLQRQMLPIRFRSDMTEFTTSASSSK